MVLLTLLARQIDALLLCASLDDSKGLNSYQTEAKKIFRQLSLSADEAPSDCSIVSEPYSFHYKISRGVVFLTMTEKSYPRNLAFKFLEEIEKEFLNSYEGEVHTVSRPYSFIKFDSVIGRIKRSYSDTKSQKNLSRLNEELQDVHRIMTKNIQDVLGRGERIDDVSNKATKLSHESKLYARRAKTLNAYALWQKYGPISVVLFVVLLLLYIRFF